MTRTVAPSPRAPLVLLGLGLLALAVLSRPAAGAVVAIDFGSEWMKVSLVKTGVPMEIVLNRESKRKTPTVVNVHHGERAVGEDAVALSGRFPRQTYSHLLSLLGKLDDDPVVQQYKERHRNRFDVDANRSTPLFVTDDEDTPTWRPEDLAAMMLKVAKQQAEAMAGERIKDAVVTVPVWFNQFERQALLDACGLAGLHVLRLLSSGAAVALQFGMAKKYNATAEYNVFYDMGASSTQATLVAFSSVKDPKTKKIVPQFEVKAVAFDKTLGGNEFDYRLARHIGQQFMTKQKGVKTDVFTAERPWIKLMKEATRVKQILSANADTFARVESLADDIDLNQRVTRAEFEGLCEDLFERAVKPLQEVVQKAELTMDQIHNVIIVGGGVRVPKVQAVLKNALGRELGQNLNGDEAFVLGAAFKGAELSGQFRVKDIVLKDVTAHAVLVRFAEKAPEGGEQPTERVLYKALSFIGKEGKRRQITFTRDQPFSFTVHQQIEPSNAHGDRPAGSDRLVATVEVDGFDVESVQKLTALNKAPAAKVLVTFEIDASGMIVVEKAEAVFEIEETQTKSKAGDAKEGGKKKAKSMLDKMYDYFAGDKDAEQAPKDAEQAPKDADDGPEPDVEEIHAEQAQDGATPDEGNGEGKQDQAEQTQAAEGEGEQAAAKGAKANSDAAESDAAAAKDGAAEADKDGAAKDGAAEADKAEVEVVRKTKRAKLRFHVKHAQPWPLSAEEKAESLRKIGVLDAQEEKRMHHNTAVNQLEAAIYSTRERLSGKSFVKYSTEAEREALQAAAAEVGAWFEEHSTSSSEPTEEFEAQLAKLTNALRPVERRLDEAGTRPKAVQNLRTGISAIRGLLKNVTALPEDEREYDDDHIDDLREAVDKSEKWIDAQEAAQNATALNADPVLTTAQVHAETATLQRELKQFQRRIRPSQKEKERQEAAKKKKAAKKAKAAATKKDGEADADAEAGQAENERAEQAESERTERAENEHAERAEQSSGDEQRTDDGGHPPPHEEL